MNKKLFRLIGPCALAAFCGCESSRYKPPQSMPGAGVGNAPPVLNLNESQFLEHAAAQSVTVVPGEGWQALFDGQSLAGWRVTAFGGKGRATARKGLIHLSAGDPFTGINWTNVTPTVDYEISLDAMRTSGSDFFYALTFPVGDSHCSLIVGGWGGTIVGISSLDGADASENETTQYISFETGKWYRIKLRVTAQKIEAWVEQKKVVNVNTSGRKISMRFGEIELSKPLGLAAWDTGAAFREIKIRHITTPDSPTE